MSKLVLLALLLVAISGISIIEEHAARKLPRRFKLKFDYAASEGVDPHKCSFTVSWNGRQLKEIFPKDHYVNSFLIFVYAHVGENVLDFAGTGIAGKAAAIDNVQLIRPARCGESDVVNNGGFDKDIEVGKGKELFDDVEGWKETNGNKIEIGYGSVYNKRWKWGNVCNLGANNGKTDLFTSFFFNSRYELVAADQIANVE